MTPEELAATLRLGPFINEDGDIWVPVEAGGIVAARKVAGVAAMSRFAFQGMEEATMSLHEIGSWHDEDDACEYGQPCTWTGRAYHFLETGE